jgi:HlyD family secretion protein
MSIDLRVIEEKKDGVARIKKGPAFGNATRHDLYIKKTDKAILQEIHTGLAGDDFLEITEGAQPGDEIIISDISSFRKSKEIELN